MSIYFMIECVFSAGAIVVGLSLGDSGDSGSDNSGGDSGDGEWWVWSWARSLFMSIYFMMCVFWGRECCWLIIGRQRRRQRRR